MYSDKVKVRKGHRERLRLWRIEISPWNRSLVHYTALTGESYHLLNTYNTLGVWLAPKYLSLGFVLQVRGLSKWLG
jgi:hypothetical protein